MARGLVNTSWDASGMDELAGPSLVDLLSQMTAGWGYNPGNVERTASEAAVRGASPAAIMATMAQGNQTLNLREQLANELEKSRMAQESKMAELMAARAMERQKLDQAAWAKQGDWNTTLAAENAKLQASANEKAMSRYLKERELKGTEDYRKGVLQNQKDALGIRAEPTISPLKYSEYAMRADKIKAEMAKQRGVKPKDISDDEAYAYANDQYIKQARAARVGVRGGDTSGITGAGNTGGAPPAPSPGPSISDRVSAAVQPSPSAQQAMDTGRGLIPWYIGQILEKERQKMANPLPEDWGTRGMTWDEQFGG